MALVKEVGDVLALNTLTLVIVDLAVVVAVVVAILLMTTSMGALCGLISLGEASVLVFAASTA